MRLVEIATIPIYLYQILGCIELLTIAMIRQDTLDPFNVYIYGNEKYPKKCTLEEFNTFQGRAFEWLIIEVLVFGFFLSTMFLTLVKSRFWSVGMDNSD